VNQLPSDITLEFVGPAAAIACEAGALIRDYYHSGVATEYKTDVDLVTVADRTSEKLIVERLHASFPGSGIYG
jgi:myo-inositol-1(or 4)-monophosphatase